MDISKYDSVRPESARKSQNERDCQSKNRVICLHCLPNVGAQATERQDMLPPPREQMMAIEQGPAGPMFRNEILAALPAREIEALRPLLNGVTLISGQVLHEPDNPITD